jgi:hypothetical protein
MATETSANQGMEWVRQKRSAEFLAHGRGQLTGPEGQWGSFLLTSCLVRICPLNARFSYSARGTTRLSAADSRNLAFALLTDHPRLYPVVM